MNKTNKKELELLIRYIDEKIKYEIAWHENSEHQAVYTEGLWARLEKAKEELFSYIENRKGERI